MRRNWILLLGTLVIVFGALTATIAAGLTPLLGLDLQGGVSVALTAPKNTSGGALDQAVEIIRNRVDSLGVAEPEISRQGNQVIVELPGVKDRAKALKLIGKTAELRLRAVCLVLPSEDETKAAAATSTTATTVPGGSTTPTTGASTTTPTVAPADSTTTSAGAPDTQARILDGAPIAYVTQETTPSSPAPETSPTLPPGITIPPDITAPTQPGEPAAPGTPAASGVCPAGTPPPSGEGCPALPTGSLTQIATTKTDEDKAGCEVILPLRPDKAGDELSASPRELLGPAELTGKDVSGASAQFNSAEGGWYVRVNLKDSGLEKFNTMAARQNGLQEPQNQMAIALDGVVQSSPRFQEAFYAENQISITGQFSEGEARDLARVIKYGALPVKFEQGNVQSVSPTLGKDQLRAGIVAGLIGLGLVAIYMFVYYRLLGLVVWLGLAVTAGATYSLVSFLGDRVGLTLTLAGVVGLIVSVGITVDSYVVYFERLKEEVRSGKTIRSSVDRGFTRAFRTILAADLVSLIGAMVLYFLAIGSVRGFAFFLGLSTLLDLIISFSFMHPLVVLLARRRALIRLPLVGIASGLDAKAVTT